VGANLEVVQHGRTGLLAADPTEWATALRALLDDPAMAAEMGRAGRERVREHYDSRVVSAHAADLVEKLVGSL
jgi:glycosyltransferase involved in cell wall biosynthesis